MQSNLNSFCASTTAIDPAATAGGVSDSDRLPCATKLFSRNTHSRTQLVMIALSDVNALNGIELDRNRRQHVTVGGPCA